MVKLRKFLRDHNPADVRLSSFLRFGDSLMFLFGHLHVAREVPVALRPLEAAAAVAAALE